ncbi:hypothetical protein JW796_03800 [Candidatus Dojkabacteria bacterium]|nr:hypothetical protein [Candidatus Dojkabacteria bacterium]
MRFLDFKNKLKDFIVFDLSDIQSYDPKFNLVQLSQWQDKSYIKKIIKGKYIFSDLEFSEEILFVVANELLSPSYISMEMALSWYGVIPEGVYSITSVCTQRTINYKTAVGNFKYRKIKKEGFFGDIVNEAKGIKRSYRIATLEKALVDFFYYHNGIKNKEDIEGLRFNPEVIKNIDQDLLKKYTASMGNESLTQRIDLLVRQYSND